MRLCAVGSNSSRARLRIPSHLFLLLEKTLQLLLLGGQLALQVKAAQLQALGILHGQEHGVGGEMWGRVKCEKTRDE